MKIHHFFKSSVLASILLCFLSCETEDILPTLELSVDQTSLSEANGSVTLTATLNASATQQINIQLLISGSATQATDYTISAQNIVIAAGSSSGTVVFTGIQDQQVEGIETLIISLGEVVNVIIQSNQTLNIDVLDDDSDTDNDGVLDANDECPNDAGAISNNGCPFLGFLINEINYDPASGADGDANGDGIRDANEDEFIEFFNSGPELDISGFTVSDDDELRHTFASGTVIPVNGVLVLFGGGTPTGSFGGAIVQTASEGRLNISNSGDVVTLADTSGNVVLTFDVGPLSNNPDESYTRNPDLTGLFEQHSGIPEANGALFSPGTKLDGSSF